MRTVVTIVVFGVITAVSLLFTLANIWLAPVSFLLLTTMFIANALKKVPANPPHKAILVFFGKRQEVVLDEGLNLVPLSPFVFDFILIKVEKVNYDLEPQIVRTPDMAEISLKTSITWVPGIEESPKSYITYLNSGGEEGVRKIIHDVIEDRTKSWAGSNKEGPSTWMEAQALKDDAHEVLVKSVLGVPDLATILTPTLGVRLTPVDSSIPTNTWMRFLDEPQSEPTKYDASPRNGWAFKKDENIGDWNWDGLKAIFDGYTDPQRNKLKKEVNQRRKDIKKIREGTAGFGDESLGITIVRFTVNEVKVIGKVADAAELEEKERRERAADKMEVENISARIQGLRKDHPEMSLEEAVRTVLIQQGKISKSVFEVLGAMTGLGQDAMAALGIQRISNNPVPSGGPSLPPFKKRNP